MFEKVAAILAEKMEIDSATITPESTFKDLQLDSLDVVDLLMNLEDAFGVTIEMDESLRTVGDVSKLIEEGMNS